MKNIKNNSTSNLLLHVAILSDNFDVVKYLISEQSVDVNAKDNKGKTPLHLAAENGVLDFIRYLIKNGADINIQDKDGCTPLHYAVNLETIRFLIDNGADYNITDGESNTRMFYAFEHGDIELIKYFIEEKSVDPLKTESGLEWTLFDRGISTGEMDIIRYLIDERSVVYDGNELLKGAVSNGHFETVKYLIEEKEVDQNFSCKEDGWTPLLLAVEQSDLEIIEYLVEKGADINARIKSGAAALHLATHYCDIEVVKYLVEKGADINCRDDEGNTPLHLATKDNNLQYKTDKLDVVKFLVNSGANISVKNNNGNTVLDIAADNNDVIQYLNSTNKLNGGLYE